MQDRIRIDGLHLRAIVGIDARERLEPQDVHIHLEIETDLRGPAESDALEDAVDYRAVAEAVTAHVEASSYFLLEKLAGSVAALVLERDARIDAVTVRIDKPGALRFARSAGVEIRRERAT